MHFHPFQRSPFASGFTPEIVPRWKLFCFLSVSTIFLGHLHHAISLWVLSFQRRASSNKLKTRVFGNPGKVTSHFRVSRWDPKNTKTSNFRPDFRWEGPRRSVGKTRSGGAKQLKNTSSGVSKQHRYLQNRSAKISVLQEGLHSSTHKPWKIQRRDLKKLKYIQSHLSKSYIDITENAKKITHRRP